MLTFNDILALEGVDPARVYLCRHSSTYRPGRGTGKAQTMLVEGAWRHDRPRFDRFQGTQSRTRFRGARAAETTSRRSSSWAPARLCSLACTESPE
jgi:hypothetical protein